MPKAREEVMWIKLGTSWLDYAPDTGEFIWSVCRRKKLLGKPAGRIMPNGYRYIKSNGRAWSAARLAWEAVNGPIPLGLEIDHINRVKSDNRIVNLQLATRSQNMMNTELPLNRMGVRGVSFHQQSGRYRARHRGRVTYHSTVLEAEAGYAKLVEERCPKPEGK